ncbi:hypothetical protein LJC00_04395, partial [Dysgonomonas sp. OttesenSCG-928-M03]|nr:hypothetical protein [Dysgonomonas sp. OttesenSCG-928-M03]
HFGFDRRTDFRHMWKEMPMEEKINFLDERAELMGKKVTFFQRFFNMNGLGKDWKDRTYDEKIEFIRAWEEMSEEMESREKSFPFNREFSVEAMDKRCEEWMKMTAEEKADFIQKRKDRIHNHHFFMDATFTNRGF